MSYMTINRSQCEHHFVSTNHKTRALSLPENIINSMHWNHWQTMGCCDLKWAL